MPVGTFLVEVDWNLDGDFADANEDVTANVLGRTAVTCSRGRSGTRQLAPPAAGQLKASLKNSTQIYSPRNSGGALYGSLLPGRPVRLRETYSAVTYNLWRGFLDDLPQHPEINSRSVDLLCLGPLAKLKRLNAEDKISTALYADILTSTAIGYVLDAVGWPAGDRVIDTGKTTLLWWWLHNADPFAALVELVATEGPGAALYEDGQGRIVFESRHYRLLTARCTTSQATIRDTGGEPEHSPPFNYTEPWRDVINVCTLEVKRRSAKSSAAVWSLGETVTLAPGEVRKYLAVASDPFTTAIAPVAVTDYTLTAGSLDSVTLDRTSGQSCTITLTAGASGATLTGLQMRAQTVTVDNTTRVENTVDVSTSQTRYGKRSYPLVTRPEINVNVAQDFANFAVGYYKEPRGTGFLTINNGHADRLVQALAREVSDRITIVDAQTGVNDDAYIERIEHSIIAAGKYQEARLSFERVDETVNYGVYGTTNYGECLYGY